MKQLNIAKRYARALAETAAKNARTEETSRQFSDFLQLWNESANMRELLLNPVFAQDRKAVMPEIFARLQLAPELERFLKQLIENKRIYLLPEIFDIYEKLADELSGRERVEATAATPLEPSQRDKLQKELEAALGKKVILNVKVDPSIIGGLVIVAGGRTLDSSVRTQLSLLRKSLIKEN